jgi:hypothetical protein
MSKEYLNNKHLEELIAKFLDSKKEKIRLEALVLQHKKCPEKAAKKVANGMTLDECNTALKELAVSFGTVQSSLTEEFYKLSSNLVRYAIARYGKPNFLDEDDEIQEGVLICFDKIDKFDPGMVKAFNYMTTCIINHFRQMYRTGRNYNELKRKYHDFLWAQAESGPVRKTKERMTRGPKYNLRDE